MTADVESIDSQNSGPLTNSTSLRLDAKSSSIDIQAFQKRIIKKTDRLARLFVSQGETPLCWAMSDSERLVEALIVARDRELKLQFPLRLETASAIELLDVVYQSDRLGREIEGSRQLEILQDIFDCITECTATVEEQPLVLQLVSVELPFALAMHLVDSAEVARELCEFATGRFEFVLEELLDGDGWIHRRHVASFWQLAASWARSFRFCQKLELSLSATAELKLEWVTRQFYRLMGPDGAQMLGPENSLPASLDFQKAVLGMSSDNTDKKLARLRDPFRETKKQDSKSLNLNDKSGFSEWAGVGVFQSNWSHHSPRLAISLANDGTRLAVSSRKPLATGLALPTIHLNGKKVVLSGQDCEVNCWHGNEDVEFVEVEYFYQSGVALQRQFLLIREDQILLVADALMCGDEAMEIDYEWSLTIDQHLTVQHESETREVYIRDDQIQSLVIPLSMGEWKSDRMPAEFSFQDRQLTVKQKAKGKAMYVPILFDLNPERSKKPRTWRPITVAQDLEIVPKDEAVAYRFQIGTEQWVFYRSLNGPNENRTFLGENQICEFYVGRFDGDTECDELLQIGQPESL